jgi:CO/xanthine dehydrogenase FAD-binding subunit
MAAPDKSSLSDIRIGIGAVGPVPKRLLNLEKALTGKKITGELIHQVAEDASDFVQSRSRQEYRKEVLVNFVERGIISAINQSGIKLARFGEEQLYA